VQWFLKKYATLDGTFAPLLVERMMPVQKAWRPDFDGELAVQKAPL
jgi:hypothetical protein